MVTEHGVTRNKEKAKNVEIEQRNIEQKKEKKKRKIKGRLGYLHPLLYFTVDCPQSARRGLSTSSSSSGSMVSEFSNSASRALDTSIKSCRGGMSSVVQAK